jgi:endonuclease/exonuclease/phosphatase family metal-dependent hydrolase
MASTATTDRRVIPLPPPTTTDRIGVATYNVMLFVAEPLRYQGAYERSLRVADSFYALGSRPLPQVICLQELVAYRQATLAAFHKHPYATNVTKSSLFGTNMKFVASGLAIISSLPIVEQRDHVFTGRSYHLEKLAAKSIQYAKIQVTAAGRHIHVLNTHLQAWNTAAAGLSRLEQLDQVASFVHDLQIPDDEPLFFGGDFNACIHDDAAFFQKIEAKLRVALTKPAVMSYSIDPSTNTLVGLDDIDEYKEKIIVDKLHRSSSRPAADCCYEEFMATGLCPCCPRVMVDAVLHRNVTQAVMTVEKCVSPCSFQCNVNMSVRKSTRDVSDHYPVVLRARVPFPIAIRLRATHKLVHYPSYQATPAVVCGQVLLFCVYFVMLLGLLFFLRKVYRLVRGVVVGP